jgi:plastocyanin
MTARTIQGVVHDQILHPRRTSIMPAGIVEGDDARDVAAYVAEVAGQGGKDQGALAAIGTVRNTKPIAAKGGILEMPADPTGQLAFASTNATAPAGEITFRMPNKSSVQHDIALKGDGKGPVVSNGGVSEFKATLKPGKYEYYCSVGTHEQDGMKGTLVVK